ncbi:MAG TPA: MarR family transcriptional regulator [Amycolatopsis sp.]|nr:MarR family transcriptional regulator [Amycolatopsis sp.]
MCTTKDGAEAALAALRAMVAIADSSVTRHTSDLTLTQFRALRVVAERTPVTMGRVARELAMNPSSVTRACERLVSLGLLQRAQNPLNKRETLLAPAPAGRQLVDQVDHDRRAALVAVLDGFDPDTRKAAITVFERFALAAQPVLDLPVEPPS